MPPRPSHPPPPAARSLVLSTTGTAAHGARRGTPAAAARLRALARRAREAGRRSDGGPVCLPWPLRPARHEASGREVRLSQADRTGTHDEAAAVFAGLAAVTADYVRGLRADDVGPEQVIARVHALVQEAMAAEAWADPDLERTLTRQLVWWSLEAYHAR